MIADIKAIQISVNEADVIGTRIGDKMGGEMIFCEDGSCKIGGRLAAQRFVPDMGNIQINYIRTEE